MSMMDYGFGFDPELPAGFQDADLEMKAFEEAAEERETMGRYMAASGYGPDEEMEMAA